MIGSCRPATGGGFPRDAVAYGTVEEVAEQLAVYGELGFTDMIVRQMTVPQGQALDSIGRLGEVRPLLA